LIFDVTKQRSLGIDNLMDSGLKTARSISVVVPVYNSELILPALIKRLEPVLISLAHQHEVVLVNDGSRDQSWKIIQELSRTFSWVRGINLMRNYGQHNAILCGIRAARFDTIVTMDDDLQHPPEEIPKLLAKLDEGFEMVYGFPEHEQHGLLRNIASGLTKLALQKSMGAETARHVSAFRAFRTQARDAFANYHSPFVSIDVVLTWATTRFVAIQVRHDPRQSGVSNYTFGKLDGLFMHRIRRTGSGVCRGPIFAVRNHRAGIPVSGVNHSHFFGCSTPGFGNYWRISGPDALPHDGASDLHCPRRNPSSDKVTT